MSLTAATAAATDMQLNKTTLSQCHFFCRKLSLFFFAMRYMWFARMKVSGNVLTAPVRLMKSPKKGSKADTNEVMAK